LNFRPVTLEDKHSLGGDC